LSDTVPERRAQGTEEPEMGMPLRLRRRNHRVRGKPSSSEAQELRVPSIQGESGESAVGDLSHDPVNGPRHYRSSPSGVECITVVEHLTFCVGNAIKYLWRAGLKGPTVEDLKKARWYIDREISRLDGSE
jgi:hypothetical protein